MNSYKILFSEQKKIFENYNTSEEIMNDQNYFTSINIDYCCKIVSKNFKIMLELENFKNIDTEISKHFTAKVYSI